MFRLGCVETETFVLSAPSAGLSTPIASNEGATEVDVSWQLPDCTAWNDDFTNIR